MLPLLFPEFRTVAFIDTVIPSKKEIFLRTGQQFSGAQFSGDKPCPTPTTCLADAFAELDRHLRNLNLEDLPE